MSYRYIVFHGTSWCAEDTPYTRPSHSASIFDASFYTTHLDVAKDFALTDSDIPLLPVILAGEQCFENPCIIRKGRDIFTEMGITHPDPLEMRQQLFERLRDNFDGIVYHDAHDQPFEIVALREDTFTPTYAMVHSGATWSKEVKVERLTPIFEAWKHEPEPSCSPSP